MLDRYRHTGRNTLRNIAVVLLFGAISMVFVLWGLTPNNTGMSGVGAVAEVNGKLISLADYQNELSRLSDMYQQYFGGKMPQDLQSQFLRSQALQGLIQLELAAQSAQSVGVYVADKEVQEQIVSLPFLQKDGRFQREYYEAYVAQMRSTPAKFEEKVRNILSQQKLGQIFESSFGLTSPAQTELDRRLARTRLQVQVLRVDRQQLQGSKDKPRSEEEVNQRLEELRKAVQAKDIGTTDKWARDNGVSWSDVPEFGMDAARVPGLPEGDGTWRALASLQEQSPLHDRLLQDGATQVVLRLKKKTVAPASSEGTEDLARASGGRRGQMVLNEWLGKLREKAKIQENLASLE